MKDLDRHRVLAVAPMLDVTDRHFRYLCRLLSRDTLLYTEMVHCGAVIHNHAEVLSFSGDENPCVCQLGGSSPDDLAKAARIVEDYGYNEVNLNVGCPSAKVVSKRDAADCFGARLMFDPELVGECLRRMKEAVDIPVSIKCRIGVDATDSYADLTAFVETVVAASGCRIWCLHARKALLNGISPAQNRSVPPLVYPTVYSLKRDYPLLHVTINGGINTFAEAKAHLEHVDGVMLGRAVWKSPWLLAGADEEFYGRALGEGCRDKVSVLESYGRYAQAQLDGNAAWAGSTRNPTGYPRALLTPALCLYGATRERAFRASVEGALTEWKTAYRAGEPNGAQSRKLEEILQQAAAACSSSSSGGDRRGKESIRKGCHEQAGGGGCDAAADVGGGGEEAADIMT